MEIQAAFAAQRGSGPIGEARLSTEKGYAILERRIKRLVGAELKARWCDLYWRKAADTVWKRRLLRELIWSAGMAELADAADSKSADRKVVGVRPPLPAPDIFNSDNGLRSIKPLSPGGFFRSRD
jgi:hypothetical protein